MKAEKQQSAVEFFKEQFNKYYAFSKEEMQTFDMIFNEAKEMEKEYIIKHSLELAKILISNPYETSGKMPTELIDSYINKTSKSE
jgi:hypothetical protein